MYLGDIDILLRKDAKVLVKNKAIDLPHRVKNVVIKKFPGTNYVFVSGWRDLTLRWDIVSVHIELSPYYAGKTCGLCGNFNGVEQDDFTDSLGDMSESARSFGNSWKRLRLGEKCETEFSYSLLSNTEPTNYVQLSDVDQTKVNEICSMFTPSHASPLHSCFHAVDPVPYYKQCIEEVSRCSALVQRNCSCSSYKQYAHECADKGVILNWRDGTSCSK